MPPKPVEPLIFELSREGRCGASLPACDVPEKPIESIIPAVHLRKAPPGLPELGELDVVRHFTRLSQLNMSVDTNFYPLGSCTMKYNPRVNEKVAALAGFLKIHPLQDESMVQGALRLMFELEGCIAEIMGLDAVSLQPAAGAHGELASLLVIRAYHADRGDDKRDLVLVPDSAHGTNPASCSIAGLATKTIKSGKDGLIDVGELEKSLSDRVAAVMVTNPNTLGLFEERICEVAEKVHKAGGLIYMDGANLNAIMGIARPGDFGVDVVHTNLHKTFSTPHGGGGPGSGPIAVRSFLEPFLPAPRVRLVAAQGGAPQRHGGHGEVCSEARSRSGVPSPAMQVSHDASGSLETGEGGRFVLDYDRPKTIGKVKAFFGNFNVAVKAYAYIRSLGPDGLRRASEHAVLNANYLMTALKKHFLLPHDRTCMHEFVLSANRQKKHGVRAGDVAKRLIDLGFHPPTVYFPLIVPEALMIEPTETESKQTLDAFIEAMVQIAREAVETPDIFHHAPSSTCVTHPDEVRAAKEPVVRWTRK
ncbi:MAG: aminomethyl-transferring glycine dehydrogenase subunit GcvPB [Planctomycetota bacterium]|nr:aminomethyl-transferring glycine dehydrogenase subunit GcvPB [Planctomycetota bacterium]